jgi:hypothetical protein
MQSSLILVRDFEISAANGFRFELAGDATKRTEERAPGGW